MICEAISIAIACLTSSRKLDSVRISQTSSHVWCHAVVATRLFCLRKAVRHKAHSLFDQRHFDYAAVRHLNVALNSKEFIIHPHWHSTWLIEVMRSTSLIISTLSSRTAATKPRKNCVEKLRTRCRRSRSIVTLAAAAETLHVLTLIDSCFVKRVQKLMYLTNCRVTHFVAGKRSERSEGCPSVLKGVAWIPETVPATPVKTMKHILLARAEAAGLLKPSSLFPTILGELRKHL